ncbi:hypothetical protein [Serpentinicella alkaliphila]|uniref:SdpI/YhfL family protein n=1 Tax=Serpentinicella alkaliphila TaxID=1734049 RepID=A0A4R2T0R5_9FIRM|nr:hypothetical protein [Serpentinicella alkaliphila]QUH26541.1 hypothetical protein HZR23_12975 [Serpentinicella alkaliphila]TCP96457.1 hypothetical protein EDD79_105113 [Serpentinicella alkaliphila]
MGKFIVLSVPILLTTAIFITIGIYSIRKKTPMHFWSGTTVKSEEISDVKAYNRANGIMWICYGSTYIIGLLLSIVFGSKIGTIITIFSSSVGIILLIIIYGKIYDKYKVKR